MNIKLKHPIQAHGETVEALEFPDRLTVRHLKAMDDASGEVGKLAALISALAGIPPSSVEQIDAEDLGTIAEAVALFLPKSRPTGAT